MASNGTFRVLVLLGLTLVGLLPFAGCSSSSAVDPTTLVAGVAAFTCEGNPVDICFAADAAYAGLVLEFRIVTPPANGSLSEIRLVDPLTAEVTYTPDPGFSGNDAFAFSYSAGGDQGEPASASVGIRVYPAVAFALDAYEGTAPLTVVARAFTLSGASLPEGSYHWDFGGTVEEGPVATHAERRHTFAAAGVYGVSLSLTLAGLSVPVGCNHRGGGQEPSSQASVRAEAANQTNPPPASQGSVLALSSADGLTSSGPAHGPFSPPSKAFTLSNPGDWPLNWTATVSQSWLVASPCSGVLAAQASIGVTVSLRTTADDLPPGTYSDTVTFTNTRDGTGNTTRAVSLTVQPVISGHVADAGGTAISGATVGGLPGSAVTNASGDYSAPVSSGWTGTATPSKAGYTFSPASRTYNNVTASQNNQGYTGTPQTFTISGHVADTGGIAISGATISGLPGSPVTNASGDYSATVNHGWSGTATPSTASYTFSPASRTYNNVTANQAAQDYTGTATGGPQMASSISQYGITWTFDQPHQVGQFVTGDWWVVGPINVVEISPAPASVYQESLGVGSTAGYFRMNGSQVNPATSGARGNAHALDERINGYFDESLWISAPTVENPLPLAVNSSLISTISWQITDAGHPPRYGSTSGVQNALRPTLRAAAVLTVLPVPAPADAFRPPYAGTQKPLYLASSIDYDLLPNLSKSPVSTYLPTFAEADSSVERPWIDFMTEWPMDGLHPSENMRHDGGEMCFTLLDVALMTLLDFDEGDRNALARRVIQIGIDNYGVVLIGGEWGIGGQVGVGRKWPVLFAGIMLNDADMKSIGTTCTRAIFQEDFTTFYVWQEYLDYFDGLSDGIAQGPGTGNNQIQLATTAASASSVYNTYAIEITSGSGVGQTRTISAYSGSTRTATVDSPWDTLPDTTSVYRVHFFTEYPAPWQVGDARWGEKNSEIWHNDWHSRGYELSGNASAWHGAMLCALAMNAKALWNWDAFFDYTDWYRTTLRPEATYHGHYQRSRSNFAEAMWDAYRSAYP